MKSHFTDEERLRRKTPSEDEERVLGKTLDK